MAKHDFSHFAGCCFHKIAANDAAGKTIAPAP
jgi:hypothetical protein